MDVLQVQTSPVASPSNFQKARKEQFRNKLGLFQGDNNNYEEHDQNSNPRQSLPGPGLVQRARQSLHKQAFGDSSGMQSSAAEKYRRDLQSQAAFPDPPSFAQQQEHHGHHAEYYEDDDMNGHGHDTESYNVRETRSNLISRDLRSKSEYEMRKPTPALNQRAASYNDDSDLFSEITVCMSQVCSNLNEFSCKINH